MKIKIGFFSVLLCATLIVFERQLALAALLSIALHEFGHLAAARISGIQISEFKTSIYGARISASYELFSYKDEIFLCAMGPLMNFILALFLLPIYNATKNQFILNIIASSLFLGALNLLPIKGFDGGRIFLSLLNIFCPQEIASKIISALSFCVIFVLWSISVYLLIVANAGLSAFVFSLSLFSNLFNDRF